MSHTLYIFPVIVTTMQRRCYCCHFVNSETSTARRQPLPHVLPDTPAPKWQNWALKSHSPSTSRVHVLSFASKTLSCFKVSISQGSVVSWFRPSALLRSQGQRDLQRCPMEGRSLLAATTKSLRMRGHAKEKGWKHSCPGSHTSCWP